MSKTYQMIFDALAAKYSRFKEMGPTKGTAITNVKNRLHISCDDIAQVLCDSTGVDEEVMRVIVVASSTLGHLAAIYDKLPQSKPREQVLKTDKEIERKFLINDTGRQWADSWFMQHPMCGKWVRGEAIEQGYLVNEESGIVRIRTVMSIPHTSSLKYFVTVKKPTGDPRCREEVEEEVSQALGQSLLSMCSAKVAKCRHTIEHHGNMWEFDIFTGDNKGLLMAELEFTSLERANNFTDFPPWVGQDVTHDVCYLNSSLSIRPFCDWIRK